MNSLNKLNIDHNWPIWTHFVSFLHVCCQLSRKFCVISIKQSKNLYKNVAHFALTI